MRNSSNITILVISAFLSLPAIAADEVRFGDSKNGAKLHQQHCTQCHDNKVYTRADRKISSYASLQSRVGMCASQLNIAINFDQQQDISRYLAEQFYKF